MNISFKKVPLLERFVATVCEGKSTVNRIRSLCMGWDSNFFCDLVLLFLVGVEHDDVIVPWTARIENIDRSANIHATTVRHGPGLRTLALIPEMDDDIKLDCPPMVEVHHVSALNRLKHDLCAKIVEVVNKGTV